jgi:hypothetical protein
MNVRLKLAPVSILILTLAAVACGGDDAPAADAGPDADLRGTFAVSWTINGGSDCEAVGAVTVRVNAIEIDAAFGQAFAFTCADGSGVSRPVNPGTYRLEFDLRNDSGDSLLDETFFVEDVEVPPAGQGTAPPQDFTVTAAAP